MNEPLRQRDPRVEDPKYLARIRELPCCVCGREGPSDAGHIRMSDAAWGGHWNKRSTGMQEKPSDRWAVPVCRPSYRPNDIVAILNPDEPRRVVNIGCHGRQHGHEIGFIKEPADEIERDSIEVRFWKQVGKNPFQIADVLYKKFGTVTDEQASRYKRKRKSRARRNDPDNPLIEAGKINRIPGTLLKPRIPSRPFDKPKTKRKIPSRKKP